MKFFCRNVHVGCAGRTIVRTEKFKIMVFGNAATVSFAVNKVPLRGSVSQGRDLIVVFTESRSWIRIEPDGKYSHRIYPDGKAAMSHGWCRMP